MDASDSDDTSSSSSSDSSLSSSGLQSSSSSSDSISSGDFSDFFDDPSDTEETGRKKRVCFKNYCDETVQQYSDKKFLRTFRLPRETVNILIERFSESEFFNREEKGLPKVPPHKQIYCFLWFIGHSVATYEEVCDRFDLAPDTVFNIVTRVSDFVGSLATETVRWPTQEEMDETKQYYEQKYGIPGVFADIDGTEIKINKPKTDHRSYYNRKGFYSVKMQVICDHKHRILHFCLGWPGKVHDARQYSNSGVYEILAAKNVDGWMLGDPAYPCSKYLVTAYKDNGHLLPYQIRFNKALSECRVDVEHTIGILKQRFRILYHVRLQPGMRRLKVIRACVVLHNIASTGDVEFLEAPLETCRCQACRNSQPDSDPDSSDEEPELGIDDDVTGAQLRERLAQRFMD